MGRIPILRVTPTVDGGRFPAHAVAGASVEVSAIVFREGHDAVGASLVVTPPAVAGSGGGAGRAPTTSRMRADGSGDDRFTGSFMPDRIGMWEFRVEGFSDPLGTWRNAIEKKVAAGQGPAELANDLAVGSALLRRLARRRKAPQPELLRAAITRLEDARSALPDRLAPVFAASLWQSLWTEPLRELITRSPVHRVWVDRPLAEFGSWYEFFPRSAGAIVAADGTPIRHGTFADAAGELDRIAAMGFDIVYLPPIHPIGEIHRKGRNNSTIAAPDDVGSPWAIGSALGGHDAVHPELGTLADFDAFVTRARALDLSVALDLALQCAPDHPWVQAHPEWFTTLPDGTIAYAENPPKKYEDIYPLNFDIDPEGLYAEVLRVVRFWIDHGVTVFRVDNPHTKPVDFWAWLIAAVRADHPDVVFLAEAFTTPNMMHTLAKVGFSQSYTYFTWRTGKQELTDYGRELVAAADYMRPNFFVNTPDILHASLVQGGRAMFAIRAILAATMAPTWGVYSGFELFEATPLRPDSEEYLDSEKYQLRPRDYAGALARGDSLAPLITTLNQIRRDHPSLQRLRGLHFHRIDNDALLAYSRHDPATGDTVLVIVALEGDGELWGNTDLDMPALGLGWDDGFDVIDLLSGARYAFGQHNAIRLRPAEQAAHVFQVLRRG